MKIKTLSHLFILIVGIGFLVGCKQEYPTLIYSVTGIEIGNADNSNYSLEPTLTINIDADIYAIHIACFNESKSEELDFPKKHAIDYINELNVTSFNIYSLNDFDDTHSSGASLNEYFLYSNHLSYYNSENTIDNYILNEQLGRATNHRKSGEKEWISDEYLILMQPPATNGIYQFVVDIELSNGVLLSDTNYVILSE